MWQPGDGSHTVRFRVVVQSVFVLCIEMFITFKPGEVRKRAIPFRKALLEGYAMVPCLSTLKYDMKNKKWERPCTVRLVVFLLALWYLKVLVWLLCNCSELHSLQFDILVSM